MATYAEGPATGGTAAAVLADRGYRRPPTAAPCPSAWTPPARRTPLRRPEGLRHDDAMIMFTGGTTGSAEDGSLGRTTISPVLSGPSSPAYQLGPQDATVAVMPLYHGHGLIAALLSTLASGGTVLLPARGRFSAHTFWDDINAVSATWYTAVPTIHQILLERSRHRPVREQVRPTLRFIRSCSAPLTAEAAQALQDAFSAPVLSAFGMTEATHQVATTGYRGSGGH